MFFGKYILFTILTFVTTLSSFTKIKIPIGEREVLKIVYDLPDTPGFLMEEGHYIDLATLHSEYNIGNILPIWITKDPKLVGYDKIDKTYFEISEPNINKILSDHQLNRANLVSIPFYNKYGGKMIIAGFLLLISYAFIPKKGK